MGDNDALAVREWAEQRDDTLARAFAEGLSDDDVLAIAERQHFDLSPEAIAEKRGELYERTVAIMSAEGPKVLRRIRHMHLSYRMQQTENWLLKINQGVNWAADTGHWSLVPKLVEAGLKGMRYMREEADGVRHAGHDEDHRRTQILSRLTPEARTEVQQHLAEIQSIMERGTSSVIEVEPASEGAIEADAAC